MELIQETNNNTNVEIFEVTPGSAYYTKFQLVFENVISMSWIFVMMPKKCFYFFHFFNLHDYTFILNYRIIDM